METNFDSLPVDIILHLFNYYLNEKDCLVFSLSGVSAKFSSLWGERRILSNQKCFFVTQGLLHRYISSWICPDNVTGFDTSHCYWLQGNFLLDVVTSMKNLNSLCIQDTKLNLSHLGQIFEKCHLIEKISISLSENDGDILEEMQEHKALMSKGFIKLTHIKILAFNAPYYIDSWLLILQLLSYCQNCVDLHLEVIYDSDEYLSYGAFGKEDYDDAFVSRVRDEFFPHLSWMANLKNFVILKRILKSTLGSISIPDKCIEALVNWVFSQYDMNYIERIWITEDVYGLLPDVMVSGKKLKSFCCSQLSQKIGKDAVQFGQLEHIGGVVLGHSGILPNLRYIHGYSIDAEGVDELCRTHPKLEHLHLRDEHDRHSFYIEDDWMLNYLKTLVYSCSFPGKNILKTFLNATPNIEELHIGYSNDSALDSFCPDASDSDASDSDGPDSDGPYAWTTDYKSSVYIKRADCLKMIGLRCLQLTTLSLSAFCLFEGDFFETIFSGCPQLRNLHICGGLGYAKCLNNLCRSLPLAEKLRDFRLHWLQSEFEGVMPYQAVLDALLETKKLERIVLYEEMDMDPGEDGRNIPLESQELQDVLFKFVSDMPHLVCFCFVTAFKLEPGFLAKLKRKFDEFIMPMRPAFWYYVDQFLPRATDPTVPRIHFDQIVSPINYFEMPPDF